jgi:NAD+ synthase (glutamine-hydrolysing)
MEDSPLPLFDSIYSHGFARVTVAIPAVNVASPDFNANKTIELARQAAADDSVLVVFPEMGLSAYSNEDLFLQDALLDAVEEGLSRVVDESRELPLIFIVGAPLRSESRLFNCAIVIHRGTTLGVVPKTYLPNYREFYEKRQFTSGSKAVERTIRVLGNAVPFGNDLIFRAINWPGLAVHVEICEDVWVPLPPSTLAAMAGATVLTNLSASNSIVGKSEYRRLLCSSQSAKCIAAYLYTAAGPGESTTDLAWDGHAMIYENGERLAESTRFVREPTLITADLDLDRLRQERMRMTSFSDCVATYGHELEKIRVVPFDLDFPKHAVRLTRDIQRFPYVPSDPLARDERCQEVYHIQVQGLTKRLEATGLQRAVIGISGGLDSTQAALVVARAFDQLKLPRENVLAVTMPGFATSQATLANARDLMRCLGFCAKEIDIRPSCQQMFADIGHPFNRGEPVYDLTFENVQAGERTSHLFRLANFVNGLVVGTGDLSEFALGFTTYGVGDQMSHYNVNASVPKTLIQFLIRWLIKTAQFDDETLKVLTRIVGLKYSPELVPGPNHSESQTAEAVIGPYELHDFYLYYLSRFGFRPSKVAFLAQNAWGDLDRGSWPEIIPLESRNAYDLGTICRWLEVFLFRFVEFSQFKRSAMPNAPKVGSGGSLSPRSDWRAPSDAHADAWIQELRSRVRYDNQGRTQ